MLEFTNLEHRFSAWRLGCAPKFMKNSKFLWSATTTNPASNMQTQTSSATTFLGFSLPIVCISGTQSKGLRARSSVILESAPKFNKILTALTPKLAAAICSAVPFSYSAQVVSTSVPQTKNKIKNKLFSFFRQIAFSIFWQIFFFFLGV